jgi:hypothetical protein
MTGGTLAWGPPLDGGAASNYIVEGGSAPGRSDRFRVVVDGGTSSGPIQTSTTDQTATYVRVRALNQAGAGVASTELVFNPVRVSLTVCWSPPNAPQGFATTVEGSSVNLSWNAPNSFVDSYAIEAGSAPGLANLANFMTDNRSTSLRAPGVAAGTYFARVRALSPCGEGLPSNEVTITVR